MTNKRASKSKSSVREEMAKSNGLLEREKHAGSGLARASTGSNLFSYLFKPALTCTF
jgi:hypothetical protein